jgi:hypothetical protein
MIKKRESHRKLSKNGFDATKPRRLFRTVILGGVNLLAIYDLESQAKTFSEIDPALEPRLIEEIKETGSWSVAARRIA